MSRPSATPEPRAQHRDGGLRVAEHFLGQFGFEVYLPRVRRDLLRWRRRIEFKTPYFPRYCFTRIELQWRGVKQCPGVIGVVRIGSDEPGHVPDKVIDAMRARKRDGAIDLPNAKRGRKIPGSATGCRSFPAHLQDIPGSAAKCHARKSVCGCSFSRRSGRCGCAPLN